MANVPPAAFTPLPDRREIRRRHPRFRAAVAADARVAAALRFERHEFHSTLDLWLQVARLALVSDAFLAQMLYRAKARLQALGVPLAPRLAHRLAMAVAAVSIGDFAVVHPGVYLVHGQVVVDGVVEIHPGAALSPWVTVGVRGDTVGPTIGAGALLGTGAKVLGRVRVGTGARIGANAVVLEDVPDGATAVGIPARVIAPEAP